MSLTDCTARTMGRPKFGAGRRPNSCSPRSPLTFRRSARDLPAHSAQSSARALARAPSARLARFIASPSRALAWGPIRRATRARYKSCFARSLNHHNNKTLPSAHDSIRHFIITSIICLFFVFSPWLSLPPTAHSHSLCQQAPKCITLPLQLHRALLFPALMDLRVSLIR